MHTLKGKLKMIEQTQQVSDSFKKREFVVTDLNDKYPQDIILQAVQDRTELLNDLKVGDDVEVTFFLRGREWTNPKDGVVRYFNSLDAWKIEKINGQGTNQAKEGDDDLPF